MESVKITLLSVEPHVSQILTGFTLLARQGKLNVQVEDRSGDSMLPHPSVMVLADYRGKRLVYDVLDGYQHEEAIAYHLDYCDYYFKRSFSPEKNEALGLSWKEKMFPLGFNYHVSCRNHPLDPPFWKEQLKKYLGRDYNAFRNAGFTAKLFEEKPRFGKKPQVLFLTRLWWEDPSLSESLRAERRYINEMRVEIIRTLRAMEGEIHFVGGLPDTDLAREAAPELIMPPALTDRRNYLRCLQKSDICIGTMGLFESIGWKTGEYVAGAKAIVNERLRYQVPGNFEAGKNYLEFETADQCIQAVRQLVADPQALYEMKLRNREYYLRYLRPDVLIENTLNLVDGRKWQ